MKVDLEELPRNPEAAFIFMLDFFEQNAGTFYSNRGVRNTNRADLDITLRLMVDSLFKSRRYGYAEPVVKELEIAGESMNLKSFKECIANIKYRIDVEEFQEDVERYDVEEFFKIDREKIGDIQKKLNELREQVQLCANFSEEHRARLLHRIWLIEREIYKSRGRYDTIKAGVVDFGGILGKFGEDSKPFVDRMIEIVKAVIGGAKKIDTIEDKTAKRQIEGPP